MKRPAHTAVHHSSGAAVHFILMLMDGGITLVAFFALLFTREVFLAWVVALAWTAAAILVCSLVLVHTFVERRREEYEQKLEHMLMGYGRATGALFLLAIIPIRVWIFIVRCDAHDACRSHVWAFLLSCATCLAIGFIKLMYASRASSGIEDYRLWLYVAPQTRE